MAGECEELSFHQLTICAVPFEYLYNMINGLGFMNLLKMFTTNFKIACHTILKSMKIN